MEGHISGGVCEPSKADLCSQILLGWGGKDAGDRYGIYIIIYIYKSPAYGGDKEGRWVFGEF